MDRQVDSFLLEERCPFLLSGAPIHMPKSSHIPKEDTMKTESLLGWRLWLALPVYARSHAPAWERIPFRTQSVQVPSFLRRP
jgi:hypothetical protein